MAEGGSLKVLSGILWAVAGLLGLLAVLLLVRQVPSDGGWCVLRDEIIACDTIRVWTTLIIEVGAVLGVLAALLWHNATKRVPRTVHLQHLPTSSPEEAAEWDALAQELKEHARNKGRLPTRNPLSQRDYSERGEVPPMPRGLLTQRSTQPQHSLPPAP